MDVLLTVVNALDLSHVQIWMEAGGYFILFALLFACGLGLPLPEDIPLLVAGALIAQGDFHLVHTAIIAWSGIIGGDLVLYHMARKYGMNITRLPLIGRHVTTRRIERATELFERYGVWVVAVGRMFAGIRGAMVIAAGTIRYNRVKFILADGLAAIVSGGLFLYLGHLFGANLDHIRERIKRGEHWILVLAIIIALAILAWWYWRRRTHTDLTDVALAKATHESKTKSASEQTPL